MEERAAYLTATTTPSPTHFAKLFTYATGQLLVQREDADQPEYEDVPFQVITKTRHSSGVTNTMTHSYASEAARDRDFEGFDEVKAAELFASQQRFLAKMAA